MSIEKNGIVYTLKARCRDCYKCLRHCPVHAIGIKDGQAYVDSDKCIQCGICVKNCPQHAKTYRNDIGLAKAMIKDGRSVCHNRAVFCCRIHRMAGKTGAVGIAKARVFKGV